MTFLKAVLTVSGLLFLGRIFGFIREWLIARQFGASFDTDMAIVLIALPDLMVGLVVSGGFAAAVIPELKRLPQADASRFFLHTLGIIFLGFLVVALGLSLFASSAIYMLAPGLPEAIVAENVWLFIATTVAIPLTASSGVLKAKLDANNLFAFGASGTLIFNLSIITALLAVGRNDVLIAISLGVICGALIRLTFQAFGVRKIWIAPSSEGWSLHRAFLKRLFATVGFASLLTLLPVIARSLASLQEEGALSLFNYAFRLMELPTTLVIGALSTVLLPRIAGDVQNADPLVIRATVKNALRYGLLVSIAISVPVIFFAKPLVDFVFGATQLDLDQIETITQMIVIGFIAFPLRSILLLYIPICATFRTQRLLFVCAGIILLTLATLSFVIGDRWGVIGTMVAYSAANIVGTIFLTIVMVQRLGVGLLGQVFANFGLTILLPTVGAVVVCMLGQEFLTSTLAIFLVGLISVGTFGGLLAWRDHDVNRLAMNRFVKGQRT